MSAKCEKVSYGSRRIANRVADAMLQEKGQILWPYRCRRCRKWHLTSGGLGKLQRAFTKVRALKGERA